RLPAKKSTRRSRSRGNARALSGMPSDKEPNMIELTVDQQQALAEHAETPPRAIDPRTRDTYVLIKQEVYDRVKSLFVETDDQQALAEIYPHVMEVFGKAG